MRPWRPNLTRPLDVRNPTIECADELTERGKNADAVDTLLGLWSVIRHAHTPHRAWLTRSTLRERIRYRRTALFQSAHACRASGHRREDTSSHHRKRSLRERVDQVSVGGLRV